LYSSDIMTKVARLVTIDYEVYAKARAAGINVSQAAENGVRHELIRIGGSLKTVEELNVEREIKERRRKVKEAEAEISKYNAHAAGKMYVDEKSPTLIDISKHIKKTSRKP
jgi:Post-segregation antitoxin CcdA